MPTPVRRFLLVLALVLPALTTAGAALGANGGFTPVAPHSPNASRINDSYYWISIFTGAIFVLVEGALVVFIIRFRRGRRARTAEGPQIRGNTNLEIGWTVVPVVFLAAIAAFIFYKLPGIEDVPRATASNPQLHVKVEGRQFYWRFTYPNGVVSIDRMRAPAGETVVLDITATDVNHSWWIPALGGKFDAIPGHPSHTWFRADRPGIYSGQCAELCGLQHAAMVMDVQVLPRSAFDAWLAQEASAQQAGTSDLGHEEAVGVCVKCHYFRKSEGKLVGPNLSGNSLITSRSSLTDLLQNGRGRMPAVGRGWTDGQINALLAYFKAHGS